MRDDLSTGLVHNTWQGNVAISGIQEPVEVRVTFTNFFYNLRLRGNVAHLETLTQAGGIMMSPGINCDQQ